MSDVSCALCGSVLGWKYIAAEEEAQRYKIGKYILETKRVVVGSEWEGAGEVFEMDSEGEEDRVLDAKHGLHGQEEPDKARHPNGWEDEATEEEVRTGQDAHNEYDDALSRGPSANANANANAAASRPPARYRSTSIRWLDSPAPAAAPALNTAAAQQASSAFTLYSAPSTTVTTTQATSSSPSPRPSRRASELNREDLGFLGFVRPNKHAGDDEDEEGSGEESEEDEDDGEVLFDSQDEDECDELFAGIWNADVVRTRRDSRRLSQGVMGR